MSQVLVTYKNDDITFCDIIDGNIEFHLTSKGYRIESLVILIPGSCSIGIPTEQRVKTLNSLKDRQEKVKISLPFPVICKLYYEEYKWYLSKKKEFCI